MIDIYTGYPDNYRWDEDKNAKICNIVFLGGTYGNFLKFFIEKFSNLTPDVAIDRAFNEIGTFDNSIQNVKYSGKIQRYHASFINDNINEVGLNICQILPTKDLVICISRQQCNIGEEIKNFYMILFIKQK